VSFPEPGVPTRMMNMVPFEPFEGMVVIKGYPCDCCCCSKRRSCLSAKAEEGNLGHRRARSREMTARYQGSRMDILPRLHAVASYTLSLYINTDLRTSILYPPFTQETPSEFCRTPTSYHRHERRHVPHLPRQSAVLRSRCSINDFAMSMQTRCYAED